MAERLPKGLRITHGKSQTSLGAFGASRIELLDLKSPKEGLPKTLPMRPHHVAEAQRSNGAKSYNQVRISQL